MAVDTSLYQHLNLLRDSPDFILSERADGSFTVSNPKQINPDMGVVWMAGTVILANEEQYPCVVVQDTGSGGPERALYLYSNNDWHNPADPEDRAYVFAALGTTEIDVFPYRWTTAVSRSF